VKFPKYPKNFWIMCWALLAFMISFNLFLPELNSFLTDMGGEPYKGLIFFMFSISALISRPFSGKLSDTIGRKKVMYIGVVFGIISILSYPVFEVIAVFFTLRFIHGISAGFLPTGATALITDVIPTNGRGVAMGIWGTFISVGFGFGNFFATYLEQALGMTGLFIVRCWILPTRRIPDYVCKRNTARSAAFSILAPKSKMERCYRAIRAPRSVYHVLFGDFHGSYVCHNTRY